MFRNSQFRIHGAGICYGPIGVVEFCYFSGTIGGLRSHFKNRFNPGYRCFPRATLGNSIRYTHNISGFDHYAYAMYYLLVYSSIIMSHKTYISNTLV